MTSCVNTIITTTTHWCQILFSKHCQNHLLSLTLWYGSQCKCHFSGPTGTFNCNSHQIMGLKCTKSAAILAETPPQTSLGKLTTIPSPHSQLEDRKTSSPLLFPRHFGAYGASTHGLEPYRFLKRSGTLANGTFSCSETSRNVT